MIRICSVLFCAWLEAGVSHATSASIVIKARHLVDVIQGKVLEHAHGAEGIRRAVRAGVASIEHGSILDDEAIQLMKERGTYLVPTV